MSTRMTPWEAVQRRGKLFKQYPDAYKAAVFSGGQLVYLWFCNRKEVLCDIDVPDSAPEVLTPEMLRPKGFKILNAHKGLGYELYQSMYGEDPKWKKKNSR